MNNWYQNLPLWVTFFPLLGALLLLLVPKGQRRVFELGRAGCARAHGASLSPDARGVSRLFRPT